MNGFEDTLPLLETLKSPGARACARKLREAKTEEEAWAVLKSYHRPTITARQAAERLGVSLRTLAEWRGQGIGPKYVQQTTLTVVYFADSVEEYRNKHNAASGRLEF